MKTFVNVTDEAVVQALMRDVDRTLLRENLKLTFEQRVQKHLRAAQMMEELQRAGIRLRAGQKTDGRRSRSGHSAAR